VPPVPSTKKPSPPHAVAKNEQKKKWLTLTALITSTPFLIAIAVHLLALLTVGSVVIFKGGNPLAMFTGEKVASGDIGPESSAPPSNEEPTPQEDSVPMAEATPTPTDITETKDILSLSTPAPTPSFAPSTPAKVSSIPSISGGSSGTRGGPSGGTGSPKKARTGKGSLFGFDETLEDDLIGTMYDLKLDATGKKTSGLGPDGSPGVTDSDFYRACRELIAGNRVNESALRRYFAVPKKLGATQIFIPVCDAAEATKVFGVADKVKPNFWVIRYKGRFSAPVSGRYRFVGKADDLLWVAVDGRTVLEAHWRTDDFLTNWRPPKEHLKENSIYEFMNGNTEDDRSKAFLTYGDWMDLESGKPKEIEILLGEYGGGRFFGVLLIQQQGTEEKKGKSKDRPLIPLFVTAEPNAQLRQAMRNSRLEFPKETPIFAATQKGGNTAPSPSADNPEPKQIETTIGKSDSAGDPAYDDGWKEGVAGGSGFGNWTLKSNGNPDKNSYAGFYLAKEQERPGITPLATSGRAWGIFADGEGFQEACAFRTFSGPLAAGQTFSMEIITPNPKSNSGSTGSIGFTLRTGNTSEKPTDYNQGARFEFTALEGKPNYQIYDGNNSSDSGVSIPITGVRLEVTLKTDDLYDLRITPLGGGSPAELKDRKLGGTGGAPIESLAIFNRDSEANAFFNKLSVKP